MSRISRCPQQKIVVYHKNIPATIADMMDQKASKPAMMIQKITPAEPFSFISMFCAADTPGLSYGEEAALSFLDSSMEDVLYYRHETDSAGETESNQRTGRTP
ncbi:hypothetical protein Rctr71_009 [Virus Rctr71]|nr:hypothetical protein Rctr71_009 [Virus Rctr71]